MKPISALDPSPTVVLPDRHDGNSPLPVAETAPGIFQTIWQPTPEETTIIESGKFVVTVVISARDGHPHPAMAVIVKSFNNRVDHKWN